VEVDPLLEVNTELLSPERPPLRDRTPAAAAGGYDQIRVR
jgi:hypothetical protein